MFIPGTDSRIWTLSGQSFDFFTPPREFEKYRQRFNIQDIARGLSHICRWGGQTRFFYSVAQHSLLVSFLCENKYAGLMHDAPEAYIGDMQRPLKIHYAEYQATESLLEPVLFETFQVNMTPEIKMVDGYLAVAEARVFGLRVFDDAMYDKLVEKTDEFFASRNLDIHELIAPMSSARAKELFLERFDFLSPVEVDQDGFVLTQQKERMC